MATKRLSMRKTREILRQKWALGRSHREVARSLSVSVGTVAASLARAREAGLSWAEVEPLRDSELEARLYGAPEEGKRPLPDFADIHRELHRVGVTLQLLHLEYLGQHSDGYGYTQFCRYYKRWRSKQQRSMRQIHRAGEKLFVDYSGKKPHIVDPKTGEVQEVELFVAALGASSYSFAEATRTQQSADFLASHVRAFEYFGGVTAAVVPDQLKSAVTRACRYEPGIQRDYEQLAEHYDTVILPARPGKPRDKAKVEAAVLVVQRWILARLRNETFFSLGALNRRIAELLEELNHKPMRAYGASRRELFEQLDQPLLKPLPQERFSHGDWKHAKVNIDYHVEVDKHYYSVPHALVHEKVEIRFTATTVEIFHDGRRLTSHARSYAPRKTHDQRRAHAQVPPAASGVDPVPADLVGHEHRAEHREARGGHPRRTSPPRAGLPLVSRHPAAGKALWRGPARGCVCPGTRGGSPLLPPPRHDAPQGPGSDAAAHDPPCFYEVDLSGSPERPGRALLPRPHPTRRALRC